MLQSVRDSFFRVGWMLPMFVPASVTMGRALANVVFFSYFLWVLLAMRPRDFSIQPRYMLLYVALVLVFLLSTTIAMQPSEALHTWFRWGAYTLALPVTLAVMLQQPWNEDRTVRWFGMAALLAMLAFVFHFSRVYGDDEWIAAAVNGMSMAYLMPFLVFWIWERNSTDKMRWLMPVVISVALVTLLLADSSTEVLVIIVGLLVMMALMSRFGKRVFWAGLLIVPSVLALELVPKLSRLHDGGLMELLDVWTSYRASIWLGAFQHPPENLWLGVGMGHAQFYEPLLTIKVKGFHNFLLDVWHETGVLGLGVFLALFVYLAGLIMLRLRSAATELRRRAAPWVASIAAILVAASLDHSYGSVSFALIMMFEMAVLLVMLDPKRVTGRDVVR